MKYHIVRVVGVLLVSLVIFYSDDSSTVQAAVHMHCEGSNIHWNGHAINWRAGANSFAEGSVRRTALTTANARCQPTLASVIGGKSVRWKGKVQKLE